MQLDRIFRTAVDYEASDIYITTGTKPVLRIHGELIFIEEHPVLTKEKAEEYIFETMKDDEKKEFLEKSDVDFALEIPEVARFRVNVLRQRKGIGAFFRLIPTQIQSMDELNLPLQLKRIPSFENGIVLVTGPTGSGKSTTLASLVNEINATQKQHIITVEDPIEFIHDNKMSVVDQREVGKHTMSFANALRASLREDPDVMLIGEMRDLETIALAITAAETGHLVFATLHTSGSGKTIDRIIDAFPPTQQNQIRIQLAESLRCVVWQTLLKRKDVPGRVGAYEILFANHAVGNLIRRNKTFQIPSVLETGMKEGMQTMKHSIMGLLQAGLISSETAQEYLLEELPQNSIP
ncbi:type IV pilus twitching motility protein PilT [Candidatus Peregrinibacteria bacterium]|nr:type IV pilus twitching motility protein PilT [Candidatus Peregrinibacteria bacterium]